MNHLLSHGFAPASPNESPQKKRPNQSQPQSSSSAAAPKTQLVSTSQVRAPESANRSNQVTFADSTAPAAPKTNVQSITSPAPAKKQLVNAITPNLSHAEHRHTKSDRYKKIRQMKQEWARIEEMRLKKFNETKKQRDEERERRNPTVVRGQDLLDQMSQNREQRKQRQENKRREERQAMQEALESLEKEQAAAHLDKISRQKQMREDIESYAMLTKESREYERSRDRGYERNALAAEAARDKAREEQELQKKTQTRARLADMINERDLHEKLRAEEIQKQKELDLVLLKQYEEMMETQERKREEFRQNIIKKSDMNSVLGGDHTWAQREKELREEEEMRYQAYLEMKEAMESQMEKDNQARREEQMREYKQSLSMQADEKRKLKEQEIEMMRQERVELESELARLELLEKQQNSQQQAKRNEYLEELRYQAETQEDLRLMEEFGLTEKERQLNREFLN